MPYGALVFSTGGQAASFGGALQTNYTICFNPLQRQMLFHLNRSPRADWHFALASLADSDDGVVFQSHPDDLEEVDTALRIEFLAADDEETSFVEIDGISTDQCESLAIQRESVTSPWATKLNRISELQTGWDGYGSAPPSWIAVDIARIFVRRMEEIDFPPTRVAPSVVGGVGVTRKHGNRRVYFEFYDNGTGHAMFAEGEQATTSPISISDPGFTSVIAEARAYLDG